ncbi:hypothetical protein OAL67_00620 [bacterium]|nr:hypothetical protein [bacterium]
MSVLLLHVKGMRIYNLSFFAPHLYLYDDFLVYRRRHWLVVKEMTISYNQIAQVNLHKILYLAHLDIRSTGTDAFTVKFIYTPQAVKAKKIIDQKVHRAHTRGRKQTGTEKHVADFEKSVNRLRELVHRGHINEREYKQRKKHLLKKLK